MSKRVVWAAFVLCASCGTADVPPLTVDACTEQRIVEQHFGLVDLGDSTVPSAATRLTHDAGVTLVMTVARGDGRLFAQLHEPLEGGGLPREATSSTGCQLPDRLLWRALDDGKRYPAAGTLTVLDGGTSSQDTLTFRLTNLSFERNGSTPLPDFEASVIFDAP